MYGANMHSIFISRAFYDKMLANSPRRLKWLIGHCEFRSWNLAGCSFTFGREGRSLTCGRALKRKMDAAKPVFRFA